MPRVLAIAPEGRLESRLRAELAELDAVLLADGVDEGCQLAARNEIDAIVLPAGLPLERLRELRPHAPFVLFAPEPESPALVAALKRGEIAEAVQNPWRPGELEMACRRAAERGLLRRDLDDREQTMQRRLEALSIVAEIAAAMADATGTAQMLRALTADLGRVIDFDFAVALVAVEDGPPLMHLHCAQSCDHSLLRAARDRALELFRYSAARSLDEDQLTIDVTGPPPSAGGLGARPTHAVHQVISLAGRVVGIILVSAGRADALTREEERFLYFLARRAADALRRLSALHDDERRRLALMVESMADGLILTDLHSDDVLINPAARKMLGINANQLVGQQFLKEALGFYPFDLIATTADSPGPLHEEVRIRDKVLHSMVSPVHDTSGKLVGVVVVLRDFTGERELARRQQEFISVVSHELRTPLTSITGALDIALSEYAGKLSPKQHRYLKMARDSCNRLNEIVDDLLDVAASESGRMSVHFAPIHLDELGREVAERYRAAALTKKIRLSVDTEHDRIRIAGDPDRLTQVLNNLISNAIKFTPEGGEIAIEIFGPSVASNHVGVSVFNNGEPIPPEARERIFDKFEQVSDTSTRQVGGTGLGLAISRAIVEAHGGRIWVEGDERGTKFVFTLPAAPEAGDDEQVTDEPRSVADLGTPPQVEPGAIVLLVDDDRYSSYILKGILMAAGHEVLVAADADEALALGRGRHPSLIAINASSTAHDALALVEIFKHDPDTNKAAVVVVSSADRRDAALRAGADECLIKPIDPEQLKEVSAKLVSEAGRSRAFRILVVDDEPAIRSICRDVLEGSGYAVREATDGIAALNEAKRFRPDLLLLDVMMPGLDGFRTAERLRGDSAMAMTPIIFLSAKGETADKVKAFRIGAEDYIVKPFVSAEMVARVRKALDRRDRELGASPTTQLPGANTIEAEIERRLKEGGDHAFCYLDLDNLKAFNDYYGYAKADGIIRQTGDLVRDVITREGSPGDFIGHIAGDDFVFITSAETADTVCATICATFDRLVPLYYNKVDRERGYIETKDRYGMMRKFPIMGVSLAVVTSNNGVEIKNYSQLATAAAAGKILAKTITGSSYVRDGKVVLGESRPPIA